MSEIVFWVVVTVAVVVAALFWAARNARREPDAKARKDDGSGDAGVVFAGDSGGDCGGGDGGGD
ncbi:hypothetical protein [Sinorhizobium sp. GL28]|uniref:hypothetical protein n=1 Tax=Sinorhizobium sp. GL28 TaxID=1358418 RepID=UPI00072A6695|nr:hypothetical protein [Sinorhizobium sp. GL28]KSV89989.1 hypothetical protein N184_26735 [Sinorhizobium sp. GL28]